MAENQAPSLIGRQVGPYKRSIPCSVWGEWEKSTEPKTNRIGREVAIKVLPQAFSADADRLRRFEQEARAAGRLNHPNILALHDVGPTRGSPYIVSELLQGETLRDRLKGKALPLRKAIELDCRWLVVWRQPTSRESCIAI